MSIINYNLDGTPADPVLDHVYPEVSTYTLRRVTPLHDDDVIVEYANVVAAYNGPDRRPICLSLVDGSRVWLGANWDAIEVTPQ